VSANADGLAVDGLHVRYGSRAVLKGVDLRIAAGEIFGLLGPNGAGKTTLIRTICGRVTPSAGSIEVDGRRGGSAALRRIGLVPQEIALYPHLTARENLAVFGRLSGLSARQTREAIDWASEAADIRQRLDDRIEVLSGGWKRRVNIAAAILHRPALLILDEPTVGVDIDARNGLHALMTELARGGISVLLATHDLEGAETLCARVGFLRDGVIAPSGSPRELIDATFGGRRQVVIELRTPPTPEQVAGLRRIGFEGADDGLTWLVMARTEALSNAALSEALVRCGIVARETRYREPGLDSLFTALTRAAATDRAA
jgi:ABC-2 type transport system ATP-binding protein